MISLLAILTVLALVLGSLVFAITYTDHVATKAKIAAQRFADDRITDSEKRFARNVAARLRAAAEGIEADAGIVKTPRYGDR